MPSTAIPAPVNYPEQDEPAPREIVAALHTVIATISPEHAALVAEYEALPPQPRRSRYSPPHPRPATRERMDGYARLRESGLGKKAAARQAGIAVRTASRYEHDIRDGKLEAAGD